MRYKATRQQLEKILDDCLQVLKDLGVSEEISLQLRLALEEAAMNVITYAYSEEHQERPLEVEISEAGGAVHIVIRDEGKPFDPSRYDKKVAPGVTISEHPIGGHGIRLIKQMVDAVRYRRDHNMNELTLVKKL